jgi:hypothetical protein
LSIELLYTRCYSTVFLYKFGAILFFLSVCPLVASLFWSATYQELLCTSAFHTRCESPLLYCTPGATIHLFTLPQVQRFTSSQYTRCNSSPLHFTQDAILHFFTGHQVLLSPLRHTQGQLSISSLPTRCNSSPLYHTPNTTIHFFTTNLLQFSTPILRTRCCSATFHDTPRDLTSSLLCTAIIIHLFTIS